MEGRSIASLLAALAMAAGAHADGAPPNVILIMGDDAGFELFPTYGGESYEMPSLNALAASGMQFNHCYSQPVCSPTRNKIMTGKYNFRNYPDWGRLEVGETTFAHLFQSVGYATAVSGKWDLYDSGSGVTPAEAGFDEHFVFDYRFRNGNRYWDPTIYSNDIPIQTTDDDYGPDLFRDFVIEFMTEHQTEPFFIYYPMALPHEPHVRTPDSTDDKTLFKDMVEYMDKIVGQIVSALDDLGLSETTILLFTTDNGTIPDITSRWNGQDVHGHKFHPDDLGNHVPLYVNWEGRTPDGATTDDLVCFSDFLPTLAEAAGAAIPDDVDGQSFLPQLLGETGTPRTYMYSWINAKGTMRGGIPMYRFARTQRWKLYDDNRLFDVDNDLHELSPIYLDETEEHEAMRGFLQSVMDEVEVDLPCADLDGNAVVDTDDLLLVLAGWGPCGNPCRGNLDDDDYVGIFDLLLLLSGWG